MLHQLEIDRFDLVQDIFTNINDFQPMCAAVLDGVHPGKIFADNPDHPTTAFMTTFIHTENSGTWAFLAGNPQNKDFNNALGQAIRDKSIIPPSTPAMFITSDPQDWDGRLESITTPLPPIPFPRRHYISEKLVYDWRADIPEGIEVRQLNSDFLSQPDLVLPEDVRDILDKWYGHPDSPGSDVGFAALDGSHVVSWATIDFITRGLGDAGLFTLEKYRRRGLAAVTTAAAMEHALAHGVRTIHWTCDEENTGSARTADKLGFRRTEDYIMYYVVFDEARHFGILGYQMVSMGKYAKALAAFDEAFARTDEHAGWVYIYAARSAAAVGDVRVMDFLEAAVELGWHDLEQIESFFEFSGLRQTPLWQKFSARFDQGAER